MGRPKGSTNKPKAAETVPPPEVMAQVNKPVVANIRLPVVPGPFIRDYTGRHVDITFTPRQAEALRSVREGCDLSQTKLDNGRRVVSGADAIRFVLEMVSEETAK